MTEILRTALSETRDLAAPLARPGRLVGQTDLPPQGATWPKRGATGGDLGAKR